MLTKKELKNHSLQNGCILEFVQEINPQKQDSLWNKGIVATVTKDNYLIEVVATGEINAVLFDDACYIVAEVQTYDGDGAFDKIMSPYIKNDDELDRLYDEGRLVLESNSWWEAYIYKIAGDELELVNCEVSGNDRVYNFLKEIIDNFHDFTKDKKRKSAPQSSKYAENS